MMTENNKKYSKFNKWAGAGAGAGREIFGGRLACFTYLSYLLSAKCSWLSRENGV